MGVIALCVALYPLTDSTSNWIRGSLEECIAIVWDGGQLRKLVLVAYMGP